MNNIIETLRLVAENNPGVRHRRLASAIVIQGKIIAIGQNRLKTDPFQLRYGSNPEAIYLHAEIDVIKRAIRKLSSTGYRNTNAPFQFPSNTALYVVRLDWNTGEFASSIPCVGCSQAIREFGIKTGIAHNGKEFIQFHT